MHDRHTDRKKYFEEQALTTSKHVIPFISSIMKVSPQLSILEIGCGEGGNLLPFVEAGCQRITGIDMADNKIMNAKLFFESIPGGEGVELVTGDIFDAPALGSFDLVMMRDVFEHIHGQQRFLDFAKRFLKSNGILFIAFPPWANPFGGHQQVCESRLLSKLPWIHLLPGPLYPLLLKLFGEQKSKIEGLLEIRDTGINLGRFEKMVKKEGFHILKKSLWFINPNFETKFGMRPRALPPLLGSVPVVRNFITTTGYYIISMPPQGL